MSFYLTTIFIFQWCPEGRVSLWYVIYRVGMALLFVGCVAGHAITGGNGVKWLTYMTDLGVMFLTLHYVIDATLSVCRWTWEHYNPNDTCKESWLSIWFISLDSALVRIYIIDLFPDHRGPRLNAIYKFSWAWQNAFFDAALFITIVYWGALHPCKWSLTLIYVLLLLVRFHLCSLFSLFTNKLQ